MLATVWVSAYPFCARHFRSFSAFQPLLGFLLQHLSMLLNTIPPIGSSDFHGVQSFALVHHPEPVPVCDSGVFHNPSTCSSLQVHPSACSKLAHLFLIDLSLLTTTTHYNYEHSDPVLPRFQHLFMWFPFSFRLSLTQRITSIGSSFSVVSLLSLIVIDCFVLL